MISFRPEGAPFCGTCESTKFTVSADGELRVEVGHWAPDNRTWVRKRSAKRVTPEQFSDFKRRLQPYRLAPQGGPCRNFVSDSDGVTIEWVEGNETTVRTFDFGCLDDRAMNQILRGAPASLGL